MGVSLTPVARVPLSETGTEPSSGMALPPQLLMTGATSGFW